MYSFQAGVLIEVLWKGIRNQSVFPAFRPEFLGLVVCFLWVWGGGVQVGDRIADEEKQQIHTKTSSN